MATPGATAADAGATQALPSAAGSGSGGGLLEEMVRRLSEELARYQSAAAGQPAGPGPPAAVAGEPGAPLPPWLRDAATLSPLLVAYDRQLAGRDASIERQRLQLLEVKEEVRRVVGENTSLHEELIRTRSCLEEAAAGEGPVRRRPCRAPSHPEAAGESRAAPED